MKSTKGRVLSVLVSIALVATMGFPGVALGRAGAGGGGGGGGMGFFDGLDAFGNTTGTIGCILNVGSCLANADWSDPGSVCLDLVDSIFGTSFGGDPMQEKLDSIYSDVSEIKETTADIKNTVDYLKANSVYVNRQLSVITGSLSTINSKLNRQTQMLSEISSSLNAMNAEMTASFSNLNKLINEQTDTMKSVVYSSTAEIEMTNDLRESLQGYVNNYSGLYTVDNSILETLSANQDYYTAFYNAVMALDNGTQIMEVLNKITWEKNSVSSLSTREQNLVKNTYVSVGGEKQQVLKFHQDFISDLMGFIAGTGADKNQSVYTLNGSVGNIGDTVLAMGDYLTASNSTFNAISNNRGIGEMYYIYLTFIKSDSITVHREYRAFMDSMVAQYMTTAWLAEMAYGCRITTEANGNNSASTIRNYEQYLNRIHAQMIQVYAYCDYEYKKCVNTYDFGGEAVGHSQDVIYYGNTRSDGTWSVAKKNELNVPSGLSETSIELALGEEFDLHYYYRYADVTDRDDIIWESNNPTVAAVDARGEVLGLSRGVAKIKATYMGTSAECIVEVGDVMAIANDDGVNRYHYHRYYSSGGSWVTDETPCFEAASEKGYDYYYGITTYLADTVELSEEMRSASIAETTGMTDANMDAFTWIVTGDGAVQMSDYQISAVSDGWTEIIGYKKDDSNHTYDFIGIPVHSTMETVFADTTTDYSDYVKISDAQGLINLAKDPSAWGPDSKYVLTADIDLGGMEWEPIGYAFGLGSHTELSMCTGSTLGADGSYTSLEITVPFQGTFDGNGHTVSNYKITKIPRTAEIQAAYNDFFSEGSGKTPYASCQTLGLADLGLFGFAFNANIIDLNVTDAVIDIDCSKSTGLVLDGINVPFDETFTVFAGGLMGAGYWDSVSDRYSHMDQKYKVEDGATPSAEMLEALYKDVNAPARFKEYYETWKKTDAENAASNYYSLLLVYGIWDYAMSVEEEPLVGCYSTGSIKVNNQLEKGSAFAGLVAGGSSSSFHQCTALGSVNVAATEGACGGLVGVQYANSGTQITDCTINADVTASEGAASGGLAGLFQGRFCFDLNDISFAETDTIDQTTNTVENFGILLLFSQWLGGTFDKLNEAAPNAVISGNQVLGTVKASGDAGGLIGQKVAYGDDRSLMTIMHYDAANDSSSSTSYNADIVKNYIACDVTSESGSAGGLIGLSDLSAAKVSDGFNASTVRGSVSKNYYTGKVNGGSGNAAGLVGMVNNEYTDMTQNISAATEIKGGGYQAYAINGRENGMPLVNGSGNAWNVAGALVYTGLSNAVGNDHATQGDAATFNNPETYTKILGDDCFLDLSGGLKADGTTGLDIAGGLTPKKLENRYRFPVETVPQAYHQGEAFVPVTSVYKYTGTGTQLIENVVTSTLPDMTKIGVQEVTLTYGDFTDTYDVVIYPSAGYLKVTTMPTVAKDGSGLSGGKVTLYENGQASGSAIDVSSCTVQKSNDLFIIKYGKYATALRPIYVDVYMNKIGSTQAEYVGTEFYAQGASADVSSLVPSSKKVGGTACTLAGTSQNVKFTASEDVCILSYYSTGSSGSAGIKDGATAVVKGATYKVKSNAKSTVYYQKAPKNKKAVTIPKKVTIKGKSYTVVGIAKGAFNGAKAIAVTVKTLKLTKKTVKGCFKGAKKLRTVKVKVGKKALNKKYVKKYKKIFAKKVSGKKVKVK